MPDISCAVSFDSQVTGKSYNPEPIRNIIQIFIHLQEISSLMLEHYVINQDELRMVVYVDYSFKNVDETKSQIGYIIYTLLVTLRNGPLLNTHKSSPEA